ncbi:hypothetical protein KsCSTR_27230 [Candidatus Kuenenia stuttgartiensis]|uniref:L-2-amino-thiazoline-4-carboxylic acid hydrolase n=1 Tax=Kuenenia stuttgartiensis TaxID=174633 RepID=A0A6G7GRV4_KUEST|nr:hypothetical protein [Candidatus Kuenenia stuttgartiensis]QII12102.1 hypothetical protein KsCSTR_27230 [Candidatus Kuenenia stuttgartiensis]
MSMVLGPIHHWMFGKIKTSEARENNIVSAFKARYGADAEALLGEVYKKYPQTDSTKSLEELLANKSIHQGIQSIIIEGETREAAIIAAFCAKYDDAGKIASEAAHAHGIQCGKEAVNRKGLSANECKSTSKAFELLGDYLCDGMPCDRGAQVVEDSEKCTTWDHEECVHEKYWKNTGTDFLTMCDIVNAWISGFCKGLNPSSTYKREKAIASGDKSCLSILKNNS